MRDWLVASGQRVNADYAMLAVQQGKKVKVVAFDPASNNPDRSILLIAARALRDRQVVVRVDECTGSKQPAYVGFSMRVGGRPGAVVFRLLVSAEETDAELLKRVGGKTLRRAEDRAQVPTKISSSIPPQRVAPALVTIQATPGSPTKSAQNAQIVEEQGKLLASVAALVDQGDFDQSLHSLANSVALQFRCLRVFLGCRQGRSIVVRAMSGAVDFDPRSALLVEVVQAMNETRSLGATISFPDPAEPHMPAQSHASLAEHLNNPALISVPLANQDRVVAVLLLERDRPFEASETEQLERLALLLAPVLALKTTEAMSGWQWLRRYCWRGLRLIFGAERMGLKLIFLLLCLVVTAASTTTQMFRVEADAAIEASAQRAVVSSFPSFLSHVEKRAGDLVQRGDVLARLDIEDLQLERIKWQGEKEKLAKEYRANLAQRDRSKLRVLEAQRDQSQAKIDLIDAQMARAVLRAPIDGVVISGDLFQALGRPVERGELLFEVASLKDYRLVLSLDENDISWVQPGSKGQLRLRSLAEQTFQFEVSAIVPVSEPGAGANIFRVEASLDGLPESLRPGMAGFAKIEVEPRAIGWIWTRSFLNWFRMQLWKFGGL